MSKIDLQRLKNVVRKDGKVTARCPACAAQGGDAKGEHLVVFADGKFGCVVHPKDKKHNRLIFEMVGTQAGEEYRVPIKRVIHTPPKVIQIVGRFGRVLEAASESDRAGGGVETVNVHQPVEKERPPRPKIITPPVLELTDTSTKAENAERRPSVLDPLLASKGLKWASPSNV